MLNFDFFCGFLAFIVFFSTVCLRVDEHSSGSYVGRNDIFRFVSIKFIQAYSFAFWLLCSFEVHFISFVERKANYTIDQQKSEGYEKRDRFLFSKMEFNFKITRRNKSFLFIQFSQIGFVFKKRQT